MLQPVGHVVDENHTPRTPVLSAVGGQDANCMGSMETQANSPRVRRTDMCVKMLTRDKNQGSETSKLEVVERTLPACLGSRGRVLSIVSN